MTPNLTLCRRADGSGSLLCAFQLPHPELCPRPSHRTAAADCAECFWKQPDHQWAEPHPDPAADGTGPGWRDPAWGKAAPHGLHVSQLQGRGQEVIRGNWPGGQPSVCPVPQALPGTQRGDEAAVPATWPLPLPVLSGLTPRPLSILSCPIQPNSQVWRAGQEEARVPHPRLRQDFP